MLETIEKGRPAGGSPDAEMLLCVGLMGSHPKKACAPSSSFPLRLQPRVGWGGMYAAT
jgi:hypothetical protein